MTSFNVARLHGATNKGASKACKKSFFTPTPLDGMEKDDLMTCIETWEERISALQERSKELNMRKHTSIKTLSKAEQEGAKRADLKSLQLAKADAEYEALKNQLALKDFRAAVNHTKWMMKNQDRKDGSGKEQERMARPALEHHTYEARSEVLDLSRLQKEAARSSRKLAFSGTDCGIVKRQLRCRYHYNSIDIISSCTSDFNRYRPRRKI